MTSISSSETTQVHINPDESGRTSYNGPQHDGEYDRLQTQHEMIRICMNDKLVLAPVDLSQSNLRVLDSATADGYWLVDLSKETHPSATFVGTDLDPKRFMTDLSSNIHLSVHSIFDTWPEDYHDSFNLVHQRFVLPVCSDEGSIDALTKLFACVKPGGWIQVHDGDMSTIKEGSEHSAMMRFREMMQRAWTMLGHNLSPGPKLVGWLEDIGAVDIHETVLTHYCGPAAADKIQGERGIAVLLALLDGIATMAQGKLSKPNPLRRC